MARQCDKGKAGASEAGSRCCEITAVVTVDERGQMVLPKEMREAAAINAGDKLAVIAMFKDDNVCCLSLMKVEELSDAVKAKLGPVIKGMT
ncbi:MAG: AbrB/MazE/SpoVT family DNA-binding domain-containing protein [candidate division WOR-3 bacterium]|nr:MAG: AbrB/MazE/SpoVT family DNA-binding domain-containing protein [candidate division WOR-3 bacterium]